MVEKGKESKKGFFEAAAEIAANLGGKKELPAPKEIDSSKSGSEVVVTKSVQTEKKSIKSKGKWAVVPNEKKGSPKGEYKKPVDGEAEITKVLNKLKIKYSKKSKLPSLPTDAKKYRKADFSLPENGFYIEYFSQWDSPILSEKVRAEYLAKKKVYDLNKIECLYIYPKDVERVEELILAKIEEMRQRKIAERLSQIKVIAPKEKEIIVSKKVVKVVKEKKLKKTVSVREGPTLEDLTESVPTEEDKVEERNYDDVPRPASQPKGGFIEMFGGLTMVLIAVEAIIIIGLLVFIFFLR